MELKVNSDYKIVTEPYNWAIQKADKNGKWKNEGFYGDFRLVERALVRLGIPSKELKKLCGRVVRIMNIDTSQTSAFDLTKAKHPHFSKKMNPNSLKNLKSELSTSDYMKRVKRLAYNEALKVKQAILDDRNQNNFTS